MIEQIKWAWEILKSPNFIVATEKRSVCHINVRDPHTFDSILMLSGQESSLIEFRDRLDDVINEHKEASKLLYRRTKGPKGGGKKK